MPPPIDLNQMATVMQELQRNDLHIDHIRMHPEDVVVLRRSIPPERYETPPLYGSAALTLYGIRIVADPLVIQGRIEVVPMAAVPTVNILPVNEPYAPKLRQEPRKTRQRVKSCWERLRRFPV